MTGPEQSKQTMEIIPMGRVLDRVWEAGKALGSRVLRFFPSEAPDYLSEHYRGADAMLVRLDDHPLPELTLFDTWKAEGHNSLAADKLHQANLSGFGYVEGTEY